MDQSKLTMIFLYKMVCYDVCLLLPTKVFRNITKEEFSYISTRLDAGSNAFALILENKPTTYIIDFQKDMDKWKTLERQQTEASEDVRIINWVDLLLKIFNTENSPITWRTESFKKVVCFVDSADPSVDIPLIVDQLNELCSYIPEYNEARESNSIYFVGLNEAANGTLELMNTIIEMNNKKIHIEKANSMHEWMVANIDKLIEVQQPVVPKPPPKKQMPDLDANSLLQFLMNKNTPTPQPPRMPVTSEVMLNVLHRDMNDLKSLMVGMYRSLKNIERAVCKK